MKKKRGFTLIEMILVIALIVILTTVFTSSLASYISKSRFVAAGAETHQNKYTAAKIAVDALGNKGAATPVEEFNITYDTDGGSIQASEKVNAGSVISAPPTPTKAGVTFGGWYSDSGHNILWDFGTDTVAGDMTLYASWNSASPTNKIISYNTYGGSSQSSTPGVVGSTISAPPSPTKAGNSFVAWYKDSSYSTVWNFSSDTITGDMTLHAKWNPTIYQITYDTQGGSTIAPGSAISGGLISNPGSPTKTGLTFGGWYKEASCANVWNFSSDTVTGNMTLFAKWIGPSTLTGTYAQGSQWKENKKYRTDYIITINNTGTTSMTTWSVTIGVPSDATFVVGYDATYSATSGKITVTPPSWGKIIEPGKSITFHFHIDMAKQNNNVLTVTAN